jgi:hypothetical protein
MLRLICFVHIRRQTEWVVMGTQRHEIVGALGKIFMLSLNIQMFQSHTS